jgi:hypothetical protein
VVLLSNDAVLESERVIKEGNTRAQQPVIFVSSPNGDPAIDAAVSIFAHELAETATDPLLNAWWADSDGDENADKCSFNFGENVLSWTTAVSKHPDLISDSIQECLRSKPLTRFYLVLVVAGPSCSLLKGMSGRVAAVRYAATAGPHRVRRNALSTMVGAAQNLGSLTHAH